MPFCEGISDRCGVMNVPVGSSQEYSAPKYACARVGLTVCCAEREMWCSPQRSDEIPQFPEEMKLC